jgi:hypothetical protein
MADEVRIRMMPVETFVARLAGDNVAPGSGAAGALAIALAAACASKAILITAKHGGLDPALAGALAPIAQLREAALSGADEDAHDFQSFLREPNGAAAGELRQTDQSLVGLCQSLSDIIDRIGGKTHDVVRGDIKAARALLAAASDIHRSNKAALERAKPHPHPDDRY